MFNTMAPVNYLAVLVAGGTGMFLGFLWYGPIFGKQWIKLMGWSAAEVKKAQAGGMEAMLPQMGSGLIAAIVMAYVLANVLVFSSAYTGITGLNAGLTAGFFSWLGFVVPVTLNSFLWEGKKVELFMLNASYYLVELLLMGVILAMWM